MRRTLVGLLTFALLLGALAGCKKKPPEEPLGPMTPETQAAIQQGQSKPAPQIEPPSGEPAGSGTGSEQLREAD